ncbi:transmembrane channel-like protein 5 [Sapajus apella]|uniref:Transmembrane channel-like protein 5 n=1 Tax=Sapajus apella TaxID=9515 RepID=A0A6J3HHB7_SAPAP|nr:transmembrane channel-like protein 5 [Sapajus apella]
MYYGFYTNSTIQHGNSGASYNMQLAYIFTIGACLTTCFFSLLFSMARYFRNNFINPHIHSGGITKLIFCWDFTVTHEKAVKLKQKNLSTEIRVRRAHFTHLLSSGLPFSRMPVTFLKVIMSYCFIAQETGKKKKINKIFIMPRAGYSVEK